MRSGYSTTTPRRKNITLSPIQSLPSTSTSTSWPNIHGSKIMLCIWWDQKDLVYWAIETWRFHYDVRYRLQLICLSRTLQEKQPEYEQRHDKVILLHDNVQSYVAKVVKKYLEMLKWDVLPHPPYSPDCSFWLLVVPKAAASHRFTSFVEIEN